MLRLAVIPDQPASLREALLAGLMLLCEVSFATKHESGIQKNLELDSRFHENDRGGFPPEFTPYFSSSGGLAVAKRYGEARSACGGVTGRE